MKNRWLITTVSVCIFTSVISGTALSAPVIVGTPPPALAPYAENDPVPKLTLKPYPRQETPRQAVESFLAYLSEGLNIPGISTSFLGGDPSGYQKAWNLMQGDKLSLPDFLSQWAGTVRFGVVQIHQMNDMRFFVELQRLEYCKDHWVTSFYAGEVSTVSTPNGWRINKFETHPEDLTDINLGGHQSWRHAAVNVAMVYGGHGPDWAVKDLRYEGRMAIAHLKRKDSDDSRTVRLVRTMEGSWVVISIK